jgi:hypothetical protein
LPPLRQNAGRLVGQRGGERERDRRETEKSERRAQDRSAAAAFAVFSFGFAVPCRAAWLMQGQRKALLHILGLAVSGGLSSILIHPAWIKSIFVNF